MIKLGAHKIRNEYSLHSGEKFLIFILNNEEFAIDISNVQEIKGSIKQNEITSTVEAPPHIRGIIYFREWVTPIIDLGMFYHLSNAANPINAIIVLNIDNHYFGILADEVTDIIELDSTQIKFTPSFLSLIYHDGIKGVGHYQDRLLTILDIEKVIKTKELKVYQCDA